MFGNCRGSRSHQSLTLPALILAGGFLANPSFGGATVVPGSPAVTINLGTDTAGAGIAAAAPIWGTTAGLAANGVPANQVLLSPGLGFPTLTNAAGVATLAVGGAINAVAGPAGTAINLSAKTGAAPGGIGAIPLAPAGSSAAANITAGAFGGGAGVIWTPVTNAFSGATGNANFVTSVSSGTLQLNNPVGGAAIPGRSMLLWGASGFIPDGAIGEIGLSGTYHINAGPDVPVGNGPIILALHSGANAALAPAPAAINDFVSSGGIVRAVAPPLTTGIVSNWFFPAAPGLGAANAEFLAENLDINRPGIDFTFWAVSASGVFNLNPGDTLTGSVALTIAADPGADIEFDLTQLPASDQSMDSGFNPGTNVEVPEPGALGLCGPLMLFLCFRRRGQLR